MLTSPPQQSRDRRSGLHSFGWTTATEWNCSTQQSCGEQVILFVHSWGEGVGVLLSRQPATLEPLRCTLDNEYEKSSNSRSGTTCFFSLVISKCFCSLLECCKCTRLQLAIFDTFVGEDKKKKKADYCGGVLYSHINSRLLRSSTLPQHKLAMKYCNKQKSWN